VCCAFSASHHRCLYDWLNHACPSVNSTLGKVNNFACLKCAIALADVRMTLKTETLEDSYFHLGSCENGLTGFFQPAHFSSLLVERLAHDQLGDCLLAQRHDV
jgi:hypothetical protein